jgi:Zn-dependent M28 family amino/carboxypeptidase
MRTHVLALAALLLPISAVAQKKPYPVFRALDQQTVDAMVLSVPQSNQLRLAQLKRAFDDVECPDLREQSTAEGANLQCTLPGNSTDTILVVAHYQHTGEGMSALDDWSGSIMLPFLYRALTATPRRHTFTFVALSGEGGVKSLLSSLTHAQRHAIRAVVALDALGLGPMCFYIHQIGALRSPVESFLAVQLIEAADNQGLKPPQSAIPGSWFRIDDTREFRYQGVPAILMHSADGPNRSVPGSANDKPDAIDTNAYFASYRTLCYYVVALDQMTGLPATLSPPSARGRR